MEISRPYLDSETQVASDDLPFEFFMNRLRLVEPCPIDDFASFTGISLSTDVKRALDDAQQQGLLTANNSHWQVTHKGRRYLNSLLSCFV